MKSLRMRFVIAAAALVVAAGTASAQTLIADIPFTFQVGGAVLQPGEYRLTLDHNNGLTKVQVTNMYNREGVFAMPIGQRDPEKKWIAGGSPVLEFECGATRCSLNRLWDATRDGSYQFARPKLGKDEPSHLAVIVMRPAAD